MSISKLNDMASEVGYFGNRTYFTRLGDVYYKVNNDDVLLDECIGIAPQKEIDIYVKVDGNVMGSQVGECSTQPQEGMLTKEGENVKESESFEDSDYDLRNDEINTKKSGECIDEEALEKQIQRKGSNEEGEEDLFGSADDFQSEKGSEH
ncbi:UNVERIFIED_CONTAM: hypothetical protein Sindi_1677100 [Sesamum indicum]